MENPPVGSFIVTPHGGNVITTNYLSLIARELFFFFGIVDSVLEKGVMAYRENTKGAMDVLWSDSSVYNFVVFCLFDFIFYCYAWTW